MQSRPLNPFEDEAEAAAPVREDWIIPSSRKAEAAAPPASAPAWNDPAPARPVFDAPRDDPFGFAPASSDPLDFGFSPRGSGSGLQPSADSIAETIRLRSFSNVEQAFELAALNPLAGVAAPLLWLASRLNESLPVGDVSQFRTRVTEEVSRFEASALARGVSLRSARVARYALCATIDDIILNTDWGSQSNWTSKGLVSTFYRETWGGERFFELLSQLYAQPEENIDVLELMALCLSIGFVGKFRVADGGGSQLSRLRAELYRTIRRIRGPHERRLSADFAAVHVPYRPPARTIWFWLLSAAVLAGLVGLYLFLGFSLSQKVDAAASRVAAIPPALPIFVNSPDLPNVPEPFVPEPQAVPPAQTQLQRIQAALAPQIGSGEAEVVRVGSDIAVRLLRASFPTGGARLAETEAPTLQSIAAALDKEPGTITVTGHTDNVPVANPQGGRSNATLSRDRADSAATMLQRFLTDPSRVSFVGRGDTAPIASNDTPEGRARNRRVEFAIPAQDPTP